MKQELNFIPLVLSSYLEMTANIFVMALKRENECCFAREEEKRKDGQEIRREGLDEFFASQGA